MTIIISTIILTLLLTVVTVSILAVMFNALNNRFETLRTIFDERLKTLDEQIKVVYEREDKNEDRIATIVKWCETLRENQDTLQTDLERVYYGVKKEVRVQKLAEEKKSV